MSTVLAAIAPVFALILAGYGLARTPFFPPTLWQGVETLTYRLLLPSLLVVKLGTTDLSDYDVLPMTAALMGATVLCVAGLALCRLALRPAAGAYTSVLQGAIRQNSYIGLAAAGPLYGDAGLSLAAVGIAAIIPLVNIISVWSLSRLLAGTTPSPVEMAKRMAANPIIAGSLIGVALNASGIGLNPFLAKPLDIIGDAALPLGLLSVGAGLSFASIRRRWRPIAAANLLRLLAMPLGTLALCRLFGVEPVATGIALLFAALPSSASSYIFSRMLGGDHELMAAILATQVVVAAVTIPALMTAFG